MSSSISQNEPKLTIVSQYATQRENCTTWFNVLGYNVSYKNFYLQNSIIEEDNIIFSDDNTSKLTFINLSWYKKFVHDQPQSLMKVQTDGKDRYIMQTINHKRYYIDPKYIQIVTYEAEEVIALKVPIVYVAQVTQFNKAIVVLGYFSYAVNAKQKIISTCNREDFHEDLDDSNLAEYVINKDTKYSDIQFARQSIIGKALNSVRTFGKGLTTQDKQSEKVEKQEVKREESSDGKYFGFENSLFTKSKERFEKQLTGVEEKSFRRMKINDFEPEPVEEVITKRDLNANFKLNKNDDGNKSLFKEFKQLNKKVGQSDTLITNESLNMRNTNNNLFGRASNDVAYHTGSFDQDKEYQNVLKYVDDYTKRVKISNPPVYNEKHINDKVLNQANGNDSE